MSGHHMQQHGAEAPWHDEPDPDERGTLLEVVITIGAALLLAFLVQQYVVKPFKIPSGSMENTLRCGDRVLVDRVSYRFSDPERGDIAVFNPPAGIGEGGRPDPSVVATEPDAARVERDGTKSVVEADTNYIKRIIGLPGETVEIRDHRALVDGARLEEPYLRPLEEGSVATGANADWGPKEVPEGTYLMLGDHRDNSADGRVFGFVPREFIVGKAFMVYWPLKRFGGLPERDPGGPEASRADPNCLEAPPGQTVEQDG